MNKFKKFYYRHRERIFTVILVSAPFILLFDAMNKGWGLGTRDKRTTFFFSDLIKTSTPIGLLIFEALPIILFVDFVYILIKTVPHFFRYLEVKNLLKSDNTIKTEAEIAHVDVKKLNPLDTQYTLKLNYNVDGNFYIKDIKVLNTQLARPGVKILILCDADDPANCTITRESKITENSDEFFSVKGHILNIIAEGIFIIVFIMLIGMGV